ncbi:MAG: nuclear transport factor 2 family protein [Deltaproteobacteria bacterium]|nr:nuclear transport factor 2 family protein [Deltaproteobacteria bacterium]
MQQSLHELHARQGIRDTLSDYAAGIDLRDWPRYRACFTEEVDIDFETFSGSPGQRIAADDWVAGVKMGLTGFQSTQHLISNHRIAVEGDEASCVANVQAQHYLPNDDVADLYTLGGYYEDRLVRDAESWKIRACRLTVTWTRGDRSLFDRAVKRLADTDPAS